MKFKKKPKNKVKIKAQKYDDKALSKAYLVLVEFSLFQVIIFFKAMMKKTLKELKKQRA
jgi:hypothetical protein